MKIHRFYVGNKINLGDELLVNDTNLLHQWTRVLRFAPEQLVELFNDKKVNKLYKIEQIEKDNIRLSLVEELNTKIPKREVYLCFSLLKKDKNEWVLQKATELGVSHFVPIISDRTEKTGFNLERAQKIVTEATEQCGRSDLPSIREPISVENLLNEFSGKVEILVAQQGSPLQDPRSIIQDHKTPVGVLIGPEGGWTDKEKQLFKDKDLKHLALSEFTLRAETACITAAALVQ
jgi:16S rRNA (uracil1498-N3)-methyltransferase